MPGKSLYEYAVIRVVPRVERSEFVNAGVILFSRDLKFLGMKYVVDEKKIKMLDKDADILKIRELLEAFEKVCKGAENSGGIGAMIPADRFRWLTAMRSTLIQTSEVHPGLCNHPEKKLDQLFFELVA